MKSRLQRNHPELFEQSERNEHEMAHEEALDETIVLGKILNSDNNRDDGEKTLKLSPEDMLRLDQLQREVSRPKRDINKFLTLAIIAEIIILSIILFIAFQK